MLSAQEVGQKGEVDDTRIEKVRTFAGTRIISAHSVETLPKGTMDFRIEHRFGDMFGTNGGPQNMFGFDNLSDMRIALEYGVTDQLMVGFGRSKGTGAPYRSLLDGFVKFKVLQQGESSPVSVSLGAGTSFSYMTAFDDISQVNHFPNWQHRFAYYTQLNMARAFGDRLSLAILPTLTHRNYVAANDQNGLFSLGSAMRIKLSGRFALIAEYFHSFAAKEWRPNELYRQSLGVALEWTTFGHNFTVNFTNASGLGETQFIPYTTEDWLKGQFRFGFCVSRKFEFE
ncbi:MAG: DUF5777 family beta-barrel protein [Crocinitomicaceae bacterium]|jgi:hypothetical protein